MKRRNQLRWLSPFMLELLEDTVKRHGLASGVDFLKKPHPQGCDIWVSVPTLSRFLRKREEAKLIEAAKETGGGRDQLSAIDRSKLRRGALAMLQQKLYEDAMADGDPREAYRVLAEEEAREKALELEARRAAVAEENAKSARRKVELAAAKSALALLPRLSQILMQDGMAEAEILREARTCLMGGGGELLKNCSDVSETKL